MSDAGIQKRARLSRLTRGAGRVFCFLPRKIAWVMLPGSMAPVESDEILFGWCKRLMGGNSRHLDF